MVKLGQAVQNLHEVGWAELGGSTRGLDLLRQAHGFSLFHEHDSPTVNRYAAIFNAAY
jgi:hypothetical protein